MVHLEAAVGEAAICAFNLRERCAVMLLLLCPTESLRAEIKKRKKKLRVGSNDFSEVVGTFLNSANDVQIVYQRFVNMHTQAINYPRRCTRGTL